MTDAYVNLTCPDCRADLMVIDSLTLDNELMETLYFCPTCGFEDLITAADDGWQGADEDTQEIDPRDLAAIRRDMDRQIYKQLDAEDRGEYIEDYPDDADTEPITPLDEAQS